MEHPRPRAIAHRSILVADEIMLDRYWWFGELDWISPEAPVPIVAVRELDEYLGGVANVARNMSALDGNAGLLAVLTPCVQKWKWRRYCSLVARKA